jgi:drug/metabolite transporter (DMT)-like permease
VTDLAEPLPGVVLAKNPHPATGYLLYLGAAVLFALNGTVSKTLLLGGMEATRLTQLRVTAAFVILFVFIALTRRSALHLRRSELRILAAYGVLGISGAQFLYFLAIERMPIGMALLIEFTAPLMIAIWLRFGLGHPTRRAVWAALMAALVGLATVAQVWEGFTLDAFGVAAAFGSAVALAIYYVTADIQVRRTQPRDAVSLTMWGMGAATLFWAVIQPWWSFPLDALGSNLHLFGPSGPDVPASALATWMVVLGTVVPFSLVVLSMQHLRASQASVVGMTEPVFATAIAWIVLGEAFAPVQVAGAAIVLGGVLVAERNR